LWRKASDNNSLSQVQCLGNLRNWFAQHDNAIGAFCVITTEGSKSFSSQQVHFSEGLREIIEKQNTNLKLHHG
jgi:hypothetical protein